MRRIREHMTYANVMATLAVFLVLTGGTAVALNGTDTVQSDDLGPGPQVQREDVADNAINTFDVLDGNLESKDFNPSSRPHRLSFSAPTGTGLTSIAAVGQMGVRGECEAGPTLYIYLVNRTGGTARFDALITDQTERNGPVAINTAGRSIAGGYMTTLDRNDDAVRRSLAVGTFNRVEGQVVFHISHQVVTVDFHAFTTGFGTPRCEFYGTAVAADLT
jgi:hypothetical protein